MKTLTRISFVVSLTMAGLAFAAQAGAAVPHDAGWKMRGGRDATPAARYYYSPVYEQASRAAAEAPRAQSNNETARSDSNAPSATERRSFSLEPSAPSTGGETYYYYPRNSRNSGSSRPLWAQQKMLRH